MTEPSRIPPSVPAAWQSIPTFCSRCQIHQATNHKPICPVCLDDIKTQRSEWHLPHTLDHP